jgi:hypothetical protein
MAWTNYASGCVHYMKKLNESDGMKPEEFEKQLKRQPIRPVPVEWRAEILAAANAASAAPGARRPAPSFLSTLNHQLSTLLWPCPRAWAGLAAVWVTIIAFNHFAMATPQVMAAIPASPSPEARMALEEQRRMLAQLIGPNGPSDMAPPKPFVPRPRGELRESVVNV